jgi:hypothetical protein
MCFDISGRIEISNPAEKNWISNLNSAGPAQSAADLTIKDLVELLLNLFQVSPFARPSRQGTFTEGESSIRLTCLCKFRVVAFYIENFIYICSKNKLT